MCGCCTATPDILPAGGGTSASRGLIAGGTALHVVLQEAKQKLAYIASHLLDCPPEDVTLGEGRAVNRYRPGNSVSFAQVAGAAYNEELLPQGAEPGLDFKGTNTLSRSPYSFGSHVAVVEVSPDNGAIKILQYVAVHDSGKIINPMLADGQVHGAIAQGIGEALLEGMVYSPDGQPLSGSLMDYALPKTIDLPDFDLDTLETPSPITALGVKGIGELPTLAAPVAIANAVMDALSGAGVRHINTPLTPAEGVGGIAGPPTAIARREMCLCGRRRLNPVGVLDEAGELGPANVVGVAGQRQVVAFGAFQPQRVVHQLNQVAVGIADIGIVLVGVLPAALMGVLAAGPGERAAGGAAAWHTLRVQVGEHFVPVLDLDGEVYPRHRDHLVNVAGVDLAGADAQLKLPLVERRAAV